MEVKRGWVIVAFAMLLLSAVGPSCASAQATAYVPVDDPAYDDLDALRLAGLLDGRLSWGQRPYTRAVFSRAASVARQSARGNGWDVAYEALARLEERFGGEPRSGCSSADPGCRSAMLSGAVRAVRVDARYLDSPARRIPTLYSDRDVTVSYIDADLNPLATGDLGREHPDGASGGAEVEVEGRVGRFLSVAVRPRLWTARPRGERDLLEPEVDLQSAMARLLVGGVALEVGRGNLALGQGRSGGVLASDNARGFDMVRVATEQPYRLPGFLAAAGPFTASVLLADLGPDRVIPDSKLVIGKISFRPTANLEVGGSWLNQQFGEGAPEASLVERLVDYFPIPFVVKEISERMLGVDVRWTDPARGAELWFDGITTDINFLRLQEVFWEEASMVAGGRLAHLGPRGRVSLSAEAHHVGIRPYTHHHFRSGATLDRTVYGSPLGPHASALYTTAEWTGVSHRLGATVKAEWYSADEYRGNGRQGGAFRWNQVSEREDERRLGLLGRWQFVDRRIHVRVDAGWERVHNFAFGGSDRSDLLSSLMVSYVR